MNKYLCFSKTDNTLKVFYDNQSVHRERLEHSQIIIYEEPKDINDSKPVDEQHIFTTYSYDVNLLDISNVFHTIMAEHFPFVDTIKTRRIYDTTQSICSNVFNNLLDEAKPQIEIKEESQTNQLSLF